MPELENAMTPPPTPPHDQEEKKRLHLESVQRVTNLPVISSGISLTTGIYSKVKESNSFARFLFQSAENSVNKCAQLAQPVTNILEKPIKLADSTLCSTMDVVGQTIPKVVETPQKICSKAIQIVPVQPAVDCVKTVGSYGKQTVNHVYSKVCRNGATVSQTPTEEDENEKETEPENGQGTAVAAAVAGNVKNKIRLFAQNQ